MLVGASYRDLDGKVDSSRLLRFSVVVLSFNIPLRGVTVVVSFDLKVTPEVADLTGVDTTGVLTGFTFGASSSLSDSSLDSSSLDDSDSSFLGGVTVVLDWRKRL